MADIVECQACGTDTLAYGQPFDLCPPCENNFRAGFHVDPLTTEELDAREQPAVAAVKAKLVQGYNDWPLGPP